MPLRNATLETLDQVLEIITLVGDKYDSGCDVSPSPIGRHVRHIVDHLLAFQKGVQSGNIDYNVRRRDTAFEFEPGFAANAVKTFMSWLYSVSFDQQPVTVISEISLSHSENAVIASTFDRELIYLINHTIHHVAYIRVVARSLGLEIPDYLGVAPATASYLRNLETEPCAQ